MNSSAVSVSAVVNAVFVNRRKFRKRRRTSSAVVSFATAQQRRAAGTAIHQHLDPYEHVRVHVRSEKDVQALKLFNLIVKLEDLFQYGSVHELELKVPWGLLLDKVDGDSCAIALVGVLDAVYMSSKRLTVEELKTHETVTSDGRPVTENAPSMTSYKYQVLLYSLMIQTFLNGIRSGCPYLRRSYVGQENIFATFSEPVQKIVFPVLTLNELYDKLCSIVNGNFKHASVTCAKVTHVSQSLIKRSICLQSNEVVAYEQSHRLTWTFLRRQLARVDPWKIVSSNMYHS